MTHMSFADPNLATRAPRVIAITSGKGGVGKTNMAVNLALVYAARGRRVLLVDADLGLANVDILLDRRPRHSLADVMTGERPLSDVLMPTALGVTVLPGASGLQSVADASTTERQRLVNAIEGLGDAFDTIIVDTAAGISSHTLFFAAAAHDIVVVTTPEPTALTDAYATIKVLSKRYGVQRVHLLLNQASDEMSANDLFVRLSSLTARFLPVVVDYVGRVPSDPKVPEAVRARRPFLTTAPNSPAARAIRKVGDALLMRGNDAEASGGVQLFWNQVIGYAESN